MTDASATRTPSNPAVKAALEAIPPGTRRRSLGASAALENTKAMREVLSSAI